MNQPRVYVCPPSWTLFIFNWRMIALQCCVHFYQTSTRIGHRLTPVPSHLNLLPTSRPLSFVMDSQVEFPESYSKCPLAVHFKLPESFPLALCFKDGNVRFHVPLSIPPYPLLSQLPAMSICLFSMSALPLLWQSLSLATTASMFSWGKMNLIH